MRWGTIARAAPRPATPGIRGGVVSALRGAERRLLHKSRNRASPTCQHEARRHRTAAAPPTFAPRWIAFSGWLPRRPRASAPSCSTKRLIAAASWAHRSTRPKGCLREQRSAVVSTWTMERISRRLSAAASTLARSWLANYLRRRARSA